MPIRPVPLNVFFMASNRIANSRICMSNWRQSVDQTAAELDFEKNRYQISLETSAGNILLDLDPEKAPIHCQNMIGLAKGGFYDGLIFHRVIDGFMIQGGCPDGNGTGNPGYQVPAEFNDTPHVEGVLSMARGPSPDSAGSQFFICLGTHAYLDGQYTAFGKTADEASMDVVRTIGSCEKGRSDRPLEDQRIVKVSVIETPIQ